MVFTFTERQLYFQIVEGVPAGTLIGKIHPEAGVRYRINGRSNYISFDSDTGELRSSVVLDRELVAPNNSLDIVLVTQPASIINIHVQILDINDNDPIFPLPFLNISIIESAAIGSRYTLQSATDLDFGENGTIVEYKIENSQSFFKLIHLKIPNNNDLLFIELLKELDRETKDFHVLNISATDGGQPPRFGYTTIFINVLDANDNAPVFDRSHYDVVLKHLDNPSDPILSVSAIDYDTGDNARITYRISNDQHKQFRIDQNNGTVFLQKSNLNCSRTGCQENCSRMCVIAIEAEDHGSPKLSNRAFVNILLNETNDHDPVIRFRMYPPNLDFAAINEMAAIGTTIAIVTVTDDDFDQESRVEIIDGNEDGYFKLERGKNFAILRLNRALNKQIDQFKIRFKATDNGVPCRSSVRDLEVYILRDNDQAPKLMEDIIEASIPEDAIFGSFVTVVRINESPDRRGFLFTIKEDEGVDGLFKIGRSSGIVTVAKQLDNLKNISKITLTAIVRNARPNLKTASCTINIKIIDVNNHWPTFEQQIYTITVLENTPLLSVIGTIKAIDLDRGNNGLISYSMAKKGATKEVSVKEKTGELVLRRVLDREQQSQYTIRAKACDHGNPVKCSTTDIVIKVLDINDNAPKFTLSEYYGTIGRTDLPGTKICRVQAIDYDDGKYGDVYYLLYDSPAGLIDIDNSGSLYLTSYVDKYAKLEEFRITVGAKDGGDLLSSNNASIFIRITSESHESHTFPSIFGENQNLKVKENSPPGIILKKFSFHTKNNDVRYHIADSTFLQIDQYSGELRTKQSIDREKLYNNISFTVFASIKNFTATYSGHLIVLDENDNAPQFEIDSTTKLVIRSDTIVGSEIHRFFAKDADEGENGRIEYSVDSDFFNIDAQTGVLSLRKFVENLDQIQFKVVARDHGIPPLNASSKVTAVIGKNENVYSFPPKMVFKVSEDASAGTIIANLMPIDFVQSCIHEFRPMVEKTLNSSVWILSSGQIYLEDNVDREIQDKFIIPVDILTRKHGIESKRKTIIIVYIDDINDNLPQCPNDTKFHIKENQPPLSVIGAMNAIDYDEGINGTLFYRLKEKSEYFFIESITGIIKSLVAFDFESKSLYFLTIEIIDGGHLKAECLVEIRIDDVNDNYPETKAEFYHFQADFGNYQIGQVIATDKDHGQNGIIRYHLSNIGLPLKIDEISGEISHNGNLKAGEVYNLTVIASDQGIPSLATTILVFVHVPERLDCIPEFKKFPKTPIIIPENQAIGSMVAEIQAIACRQHVKYFIAEGNHQNIFEIDPYDGILILTGFLSFGNSSLYHLEVVAATSISNSSFFLDIIISDPIIDYPVIETNLIHIQENNEAGKVCGKVLVTGLVDKNLIIMEIIQQIPHGQIFRLEDENLICEDILDRETANEYQLFVRAANKRKRDRKMEKSIKIIIGDENDNPPFCKGVDNFLISDKAYNIEWNCFDVDEGLNSSVGYYIPEENAPFISEYSSKLIRIQPFDGKPRHFSAIIFDRSTKHNNLSTMDHLRRSIERRFTIIPHRPSSKIRFAQSKDFFEIDSETPLGSIFGSVSVETNSSLEYFITSFRERNVDALQFIDIDRRTGQLRVIRKPNASQVQIEITVVSDGFTNSKTVSIFFFHYSKLMAKLNSPSFAVIYDLLYTDY